jgi:uroporphyrinogen decarboxylase
MGIDVLNPVQADAKNMEPQKIKSEFGDKLAFHGGIDIIDTLPNGTPSQVQGEVKSRISTLGTKGGYILASSHHIQADTPLENIDAMYDINIR